LHHFEGVWKSPGGKTTSISDFDYEAKQPRFGGFWDMVITEQTPQGLWTLEAIVDGEVTGTHTFQIVGGAPPRSDEPSRSPLAPAELYRMAVAGTVSIQNLNAQGQQLNDGSGFLIESGLIITAFQVIDGATSARVTFPDGSEVQAQEVVAWNRRQDWAILRLKVTTAASLPSAKHDTWSVGDVCFFLDATAPGNRIIVNTTITGMNKLAEAGERINLANRPSSSGIGTALLNEYGEVIGVVGGSLVPGASTMEGVRHGAPPDFLLAEGLSSTAMVTPLTQISIPDASVRPTAFEELTKSGQFIPPVTPNDGILYATLARDTQERKELWKPPVEEKSQFSRHGGNAAFFMSLEAEHKKTETAAVRIYNIDNHLVLDIPPTKFRVQNGKLLFLNESLNISSFQPGVYRLDVLMDGTPSWRTFFRVTE
jgi:hypothetical protein